MENIISWLIHFSIKDLDCLLQEINYAINLWTLQPVLVLNVTDSRYDFRKPFLWSINCSTVQSLGILDSLYEFRSCLHGRSISCTLILLLSSQPTDSSPQDAGFIPFNRGINGQMMVELGLSLNVLSF